MIVYGHDVEPFTADEFDEWAAAQTWTFARTMLDNPHYYTNRAEVEPFMRALATIRAGDGPVETWGWKVWKLYTDPEGIYRYWTGVTDRSTARSWHHLNRTYADESIVDMIRMNPYLAALPYEKLVAMKESICLQ